MRLHVVPLIALLSGIAQQTAPPPPAHVVTPPPAQRPAPKLYDETANGAAQIKAAIAAAHVDAIRVLINWGANGDALSTAFAAALRLPVVVQTRYSADEYKVVNVDVGRADRNLDLAKRYGATIKAGALPALTVLDETGKVLAQATAAEFLSSPAAFDPAKIAAFLTAHQAPAPDAIQPFNDAVARAKRDGKTVFVWFSAPW
jgi:hypothetical protein